MESELRVETSHRDLELPEACAGCGGPLAVRIGPGTTRGVCLGCRAVTPLMVIRAPEGARVVQAPAGLA